MSQIHDLIEQLGKKQARQESNTPQIVDAASAMMAAESETLGVTYSGFALTSLPHKRLANDAIWERRGHRVRLLVEPGRLPTAQGGYHLYGVPYGAQARLILIYLQGQAIRHGSPEIELGRSMYEWLSRMGLSIGGRTYQRVREQAARLSACLLTFSWQDGKKVAFSRDSIVRSGLFLGEDVPDPSQHSLWSEHVVLSDTFFRELREHAIPLSEEALAQINNNSLTIDIYVWLAYRLYALSKPTFITWKALQEQFGPEYQRLRDFRKRFTDAFNLAVAVYPDARVSTDETGITLYPSRPPIAPRQIAAGR